MLQRTIDNLRARPHHERRVFARGFAYVVAIVLFIGWVILFFNSIRNNPVRIDIPRPGFNTPTITAAQDQLANSWSGMQESIQTLQDSAAAAQNDTGTY